MTQLVAIKNFTKYLNSNVLPGVMIAMVEERTYIVEYENEVFIIYDPLEGFYALHEEYRTLEEYMKIKNISSLNCCKVYNKEKLYYYIKKLSI